MAFDRSINPKIIIPKSLKTPTSFQPKKLFCAAGRFPFPPGGAQRSRAPHRRAHRGHLPGLRGQRRRGRRELGAAVDGEGAVSWLHPVRPIELVGKGSSKGAKGYLLPWNLLDTFAFGL